MATAQLEESGIVDARCAAHAFSGARIAPAVAAAITFLLFVLSAAHTENPLAYLVGMTPIAWIAIEGVWHLFRRQ